jgi:hypothetical protein
VALFPELEDQISEVLLTHARDQLGCGLADVGHAHVERAVIHEAEATLCHVELRRTDSEIEEETIHRTRDERRCITKLTTHGREPITEASEAQFRGLQRSWITVDAEHTGTALEERFRVSTTAESSIDDHAALRGLEHLHGLLQEDRLVNEGAHP